MSAWLKVDWQVGEELPSNLYEGANTGAQELLHACAGAYRSAGRLLKVETELSRILFGERDLRPGELYPVYFRMARYYDACVDDHQLALPFKELPEHMTPEVMLKIRWWEWYRAEIRRLQANENFTRAVCEAVAFEGTDHSVNAVQYLRSLLDYEYILPGQVRE